jgi:hypothetical protein
MVNTTLTNLFPGGKKKQPFAFLVAGSRDYTNYTEFAGITDHLLSQVKDKYDLIVFEGEARGTDTLAKKYASEKGYKLAPYPADWDLYGKAAGLWRNEVMTSEVSLYPKKAALFFCSGDADRGIDHCISQAQERGIPLKIWNFKSRKFVRNAK